jgi:hypothetical protein
LEETTARQMQSTLYTPDVRLLGTAYGFFDWSDNGQRTLGHTGYEPPMHSVMLLLPDENLGVFVAYNSQDTGDLTTQHVGFQRAFFDHYYPTPAVEPIEPAADFAPQADRFVASYRESSSAHTTLAKTAGLFGATEISNPGDGTLLLSKGGVELRFAEVEPLYFRQVDGPFHMICREDKQGRITHMYTDLMPQYTMVKLAWYETPGFNLMLLMGGVLVFLVMPAVTVIRGIRNHRQGGGRKPTPRGARVATGIIVGLCVLNVFFTAGTMQWIMQPSELHSPLLIFKIVLGLGVVSTLLTVGALAYCVLAWKDRYWGVAFRACYTLTTVAAVAFVWFLNYWNMLGWRF